VVRSRWAHQRGRGRPSRIIDVHEAVDALPLTNDRNLLLPYLVSHIALARVPGAGAVEEPVPQRDELDPRRRRCARFKLRVGASAMTGSAPIPSIRLRNRAIGSARIPHADSL